MNIDIKGVVYAKSEQGVYFHKIRKDNLLKPEGLCIKRAGKSESAFVIDRQTNDFHRKFGCYDFGWGCRQGLELEPNTYGIYHVDPVDPDAVDDEHPELENAELYVLCLLRISVCKTLFWTTSFLGWMG